MTVRAILFDFNGLLLEDETFHWRAFREVLRPFGVTLSRARYNARYLVFDDRTALEAILRDSRSPRAELESLLRRKRRTYARLARRLRIDPRAAGRARRRPNGRRSDDLVLGRRTETRGRRPRRPGASRSHGGEDLVPGANGSGRRYRLS